MKPLLHPVSVALRVQQAVRLRKPIVFTMLTPAPIKAKGLGEETTKEPSAWDATNSALKSLTNVVGAGTKFYVEREQNKQLQQQADLAQRQVQAAQQKADMERQYAMETQRAAELAAASAPKGLPAWVLPAAIAGVVLAAVGGYFIFKKKA